MHEHYQNAGAQVPAHPMADQAVDIQRSYAEGRIRRSGDQSPPPSPSSPMLPRVVERVAAANDELRSLASMIGAFANRVMGSVPTTDGLTGKTAGPRNDCAASTLSELQDEQQRLINLIRAEAFRLDGIA